MHSHVQFENYMPKALLLWLATGLQQEATTCLFVVHEFGLVKQAIAKRYKNQFLTCVYC